MILFHEKDCIVQIPFGKRALCTKMATDETADKDRRAYKVPIPGNKSVVVTYGRGFRGLPAPLQEEGKRALL